MGGFLVIGVYVSPNFFVVFGFGLWLRQVNIWKRCLNASEFLRVLQFWIKIFNRAVHTEGAEDNRACYICR